MKLYDPRRAHTQNPIGWCGGSPDLPRSVQQPRCSICDEPMVFFFRVDFPEGHTWEWFSLALFSCIDCVSESTLIPEMISGPLIGAAIERDFLRRYQTNFRFVVFPTKSASQGGIRSPIRKTPVFSVPGLAGAQGILSGSPQWLLEDETPARVADDRPTFLLQLFEGLSFPTESGARGQMTLDLAGSPVRSHKRSYQLFIGNSVFLFGAEKPSELVYALTQI